jgi:predicted nucleic acid-binding protein
MGDVAKAQAVANSGPIIHLHEIGELGILGVFSKVHYSDAVWQEVVESGRVPAAAIEGPATIRHSVAAATVALVREDRDVKGLHEGEIQALALCRELAIDLLLTDDLAARAAASRLGIRPRRFARDRRQGCG